MIELNFLEDKSLENDKYLKCIDHLLNQSTKSISIPRIGKSNDYGTEYIFPEKFEELDNELLASLALKLSGWVSYLFAEQSRRDTKKRLLKDKYEYIYKVKLLQAECKVLVKTGYLEIKGQPKEPKNTKLCDVWLTSIKERVKADPDILKAYTELEMVDMECKQIDKGIDALETQIEALSRETFRRQTEAKIFSKGEI